MIDHEVPRTEAGASPEALLSHRQTKTKQVLNLNIFSLHQSVGPNFVLYFTNYLAFSEAM